MSWWDVVTVTVGAFVGAGAACAGSSDRSRLSFSNHGARLDLQGWGQCVTTSGYGGSDEAWEEIEGSRRRYVDGPDSH